MNSEREFAKLMEELKKRDFKTEEELNDFMNSLLGQSLDKLPKSTDKIGLSQDLVFKAYEKPDSQGKKLVKQALELDPNNAEAYNYLASKETDIDNAIKMFEKAIKAGENTLGKDFFIKEKGYFWGFIQTRPYMRAKAGLAECLRAKGEFNSAINIYQEMIALNPNDNQGVRYSLSTLLLGKNDLSEFENFIAKHEDEDEDCALWNFNMALYNFKQKGVNVETEKILLKAHKSNEFVIDLMLGFMEMPDERPRYIGRGDESEAVNYIEEAFVIWEETEGAFDWLYMFRKKRLRMN